MQQHDLEKAVEVAPDIFWVSQRDPNSLLQINVFLRRFRADGRAINFLIDPGPSDFFPTISRKVGSIISDITQVQMYSINHQDPDVGMNSTFISKMNPRSLCLCTEDTWRLIRFFEIPSKTYKNIHSFDQRRVTLATSKQHVLDFVPTPYAHFVGCFAIYDRQARALFTGDLLGGLNPPGNLDLFAGEGHWDGIKTFHQIYMPSKKSVQYAIDAIRALDPPPLMIIPQHGAILQGEVMETFLNRLYNVDMGMDLFGKQNEEELIRGYSDVIATLYQRFLAFVGPEEVELLFDFADRKQDLMHLVDMDIQGLKKIFAQPEQALGLFLNRIAQYHDRGVVNEIKSLAIKETLQRRLPLPMDHLYQDAFEDSSRAPQGILDNEETLLDGDAMLMG
ncbi:hypothetical protein COW36_08555 [bacterium (Candidatus Blackallbacteria) CG17_big_fil_post_rev_8_21_14_2_50_48_46]|uniref:ODP domain-containing protein n=1 Tax=bacterium (Candidatus Blackallbacteria) CG17_big_fil_post_rev_8_21_14_2_50_48_46 TaxID=2014261 RepID=A0A2M7G663_9BACT|nr:MAG: hypothetical protein COW64_05855 [bacterium (Candidatus Blackallbacteria) CG18_big_fil_WC_8_21_14_2_50_49_26]PIW17537.1 MAG: hypothetical protein COW36_08555 [bacterium (Candidatus Blackallbacteria) CG17_big_fil_post_rev_8_21_14_2_50_48_46]PIW48392.1 MAG: hypothetical protein COW20_09905 [bacterium (Candidatus Blackallbacteria) CG13_big_fil_rev_8_21_14_2_50_49_14]